MNHLLKKFIGEVEKDPLFIVFLNSQNKDFNNINEIKKEFKNYDHYLILLIEHHLIKIYDNDYNSYFLTPKFYYYLNEIEKQRRGFEK